MAEKIVRTEYSEEMQKSYLDYSMSVITSRAIPDVRDGLKPVQRRVLYDMSEIHTDYDKPHRKCARIVGDTMGKYHPHGDSSIYETLVGLAQDFKRGMVLVDGHGNFGSIEGDQAAAMRYTEARLSKFAQEVYLKDLDKTVDFVSNYDETEKEPEVLPVRVPNILINGADGIAVGMSTSIPTHNLGEVIDVLEAYIDNRLLTVDELMEYMPGPDFPTGGIIANKSELLSIYETGVGKIKIRGKTEVELGKKKSDRDKLVITEIPYTMIGAGINKFLIDVADLVESRKLPDVVDISNQSNKDGIRIVLELKKDADIEKIRNILYKKTKLEDTFGVNMLAISDGRPEVMNLKQILYSFMEFQYVNLTRKYTTLLNKEMEKKEVQEGLIEACDIIDLIIAVLRGSKNVKDAKDCLMTGNIENIKLRTKAQQEEASKLCFTDRQAQAILDMRLYRLIGLEVEALQKSYKETLKNIRDYRHVLASQRNMDEVIKKDLDAIKAEFATPRKTEILDCGETEIEEEAADAKEVVFVLDRFGYCKTIDKSIFDKNSEAVLSEGVRTCDIMTDDRICLFTDSGNLYQIKVSDIPAGKVRDKGVPVENISKFDGTKECIRYLIPAAKLIGTRFLFATEQGLVKLVDGDEFVTANRQVAATKLSDGDSVVSIRIPGNELEVVLRTANGMFLKFPIDEIPLQKKNSRGVRGIKLDKEDKLECVYLPMTDDVITYRDKPVYLTRLKIAKRDQKGSKKY